LLNRLKPKSEFSKNVLTLMTGTTIAQAIPIAISPILTRIYTPEDFGVFALFISIVSIFGSIANGRYELAIMLPKKDEDAINIVALSIIISFFVSFIAFLIVFIFNTQITNLLGNQEILNWLYFIPLTVLFTGLYQSFNYWLNRKKQYKRLATSRVVQTGTTATSNLSMGFCGFGSSGLILSGILGQGVATAILAKMVWGEDKYIIKEVKKLKIFALAKRYIKFPKFDLPSSIIYSFYSNMAVIFFTKFFESSVSGFYFFANRIIKTPFNFFISAFSDVFYQKLSETRGDYEKIAKEINYFSVKLFKITFIPFFLIVYSSYFSVELIFGEKWKELYIYIFIFSMPIYIGVLLAPYGHVLKIIDRQEISMYLHFFRLMVLGVFFISYFYMNYNLLWFLFIYAILDTLLHLFLGFFVDSIIDNQQKIKINLYKVLLLCCLAFINFKIIF
jgi:O-antigen/teichoic acid export membrane protein